MLKFHNVDCDETPEGIAVEVATRSESSVEPTFAHTSVADAYKDEQYCAAHIPLNPQPNTGETQLWVFNTTQQHQCTATCSFLSHFISSIIFV